MVICPTVETEMIIWNLELKMEISLSFLLTFEIVFFLVLYFPVRDSASFPEFRSQRLEKLLCNLINDSKKGLLEDIPLFSINSVYPLGGKEEDG